VVIQAMAVAALAALDRLPAQGIPGQPVSPSPKSSAI
jgi:hypothetical protein